MKLMNRLYSRISFNQYVFKNFYLWTLYELISVLNVKLDIWKFFNILKKISSGLANLSRIRHTCSLNKQLSS